MLPDFNIKVYLWDMIIAAIILILVLGLIIGLNLYLWYQKYIVASQCQIDYSLTLMILKLIDSNFFMRPSNSFFFSVKLSIDLNSLCFLFL